jgi:flagellar hook-associated protein 2
MATVGLNFGSPTGGQGFDVTTTVNSILGIQSAIEAPWKAQIASLQAQDTQLTSLGTDLASLASALSPLTDFEGLFSAKQGSSSNPDVLTLTSAGTSAVAGSHTIVVTSLAQTSSAFSAVVVNPSDVLTGTLSIQIGPVVAGSAGTPVPIASGGETLAQLSATINGGSYGVTASVITSTAGSRLSLVSNTGGKAGLVTVTPGLTDSSLTVPAAVGFPDGQEGLDAVLTVDGLKTTSASNTVTGAIPGVTFQLLSSPPDTQVQVLVTNDNNSIETAAQSLVTAYNKIVSDIKTQEGNDSTGTPEPLFGSPTLSLLQTQLSQALYATTTGTGGISSLDQIGITSQEDGTLSLDTSTLDSALNSNYTGVQGYFQNLDSFGYNLNSTLENLSSTNPTGAIFLSLAQDKTEEGSLATSVTTEDASIAAQKITLTAELNAANEILQGIPDQLNQVAELYNSFTGYNQTK